MQVRTIGAVATATALFVAAAADAQLLPADVNGLSAGHVLLNVSNVDAHRDFWTRHFDATPITVGKLHGVRIPGIVVLFRSQTPTGPSEGTTINHMGLKLRQISDYLRRFDRSGTKYDPPRVGRENTPQTYVYGPDSLRMELVEDSRLPAPVISHHLHYWLEHPRDAKAWYVRKLLVRPTMRGPYESGDVPGVNLTFAPLGTQKVPGVATKGRLLDSIGFDVVDLRSYTVKLAANGISFDVPYGRDAELGLMTATLTDPWGATIRLTEGLGKAAGVASFRYRDGFVVDHPLE